MFDRFYEIGLLNLLKKYYAKNSSSVYTPLYYYK